jgi:integrase
VGEALDILKSLEAAKGDSEYVFVGKGGKRPIVGLGKAIKRVIGRSGVDFWIHDSRRTLSTSLGELGVSDEHIAKVLNHIDKKDVTGIYNRHKYDKEKHTALMKWDRRLREILTGQSGAAKVLAFAR